MKARNVFTCLLLVSLYYHHTTSQPQCHVVHGRDCSHIWDKNNASTSGIYRIHPIATNFSFEVFCEMSTNGGWTLIQRHDGSDALDFDRTFKEYQNGFGKLQGELWLGLKYFYALTQQTDRPAKLHISIGSFDGKEAYAEYNPFSVGNEDSSYKLSAGKYSGTAGDAFSGDPAVKGSNQHGSNFSTWDHPTDNCDGSCLVGDMRFLSCSEIVSSGWWFNACGLANLNGIWRKPPRYKNYASSVSWPTWKVRESLKFSRMYLIHH
ncbi:fibrinogen-like protein 1 [Hyla sarda]|uniref:fibrinogen-like protein 1 n=1 Tax=Hyla sarda TaxID=327740 RepID=UPI0024C38137|nr:fibrinogen-like protein 1 [Hyla sarda]